LNRKRPVSLTVISNHHGKYARLTASWQIPTCYLSWHRWTFSRALRMHDVAVIPIRRNPFTECKTNNRVATALIHGVAVAADSIPSYRALAEGIVLDDWAAGLQRLTSDAAFRSGSIERGAALVRSGWSIEQIAKHWLRALSQWDAEPSIGEPLRAH
jgi:hypothetical protein